MKKVLLILCAVVLAFTGCSGSAAKKLMNETRLAITEGDYIAAQNYGELAIKEGCKDEEFLNIVYVLNHYGKAKTQFEEGNIEEAKKTLENIGDTDGTGMTQAVDSLKKEIEKIETETNKFDSLIENMETALDEGRYTAVLEIAGGVSENEGLAESQKNHIKELVNKANEKMNASSGQNSESGPSGHPQGKAMLTEQEAIEVAKKYMEISPSSRVSVTLNGYKYNINVETDYTYNGETNTDEKGCVIDALTGEVEGLAG